MSNIEINVLVLAVGSPLGQSILKALKMSTLPKSIHAADISDLAAGFYLNPSQTVTLPPVKDRNYLTHLSDYIRCNSINVIFPVIALEHVFFASHQAYFRDLGVHIISCDSEIYDICNDKFRSMQFLRKNGINAPDTELCDDSNKIKLFLNRNKFPLFLKPRFGASSTDVFKVNNRDELMGVLHAFDNNHFVVQQYLADPRDFTIGIFTSINRKFQESLIIERELKFGLSYRGKIINDHIISSYCFSIANTTKATYSINVQLKLEDGVPYCYEINPRLSSTTCVRAHFGYNEPELILRDLFFGLDSYTINKRKGRFTRYWQEHYIEAI